MGVQRSDAGGDRIDPALHLAAHDGNLLALRAAGGSPVIAMSDTAWQSLAPGKRRELERHGRIVTAPIPTIERHGGGSVRCMIAEVFLPRGTRGGRC